MENNVFNMTSNETQRNSIATDGTPSISLVQPDLNIQNQIMSGYPVISTLQGEEPSGFGFAPIVSSHPNQILHDQFSEGTPISAAALATLLATRSCLQESIINNLAPSVFPSEIFRTYASNDCTNSSSSSFITTSNTGFDGALGSMNSRWDFDKFLALSDPAGKPPDRAGFQPFQLVESMDPNGINHHCSSKFSNELSLSLATLQPSVFCGKTVPDQCSDISSNGINHNCLNETGLGSDQTSFSSKELSLSFGSYKPGQFSHIISGSRYLGVVQEILAEIASYSLENLNQLRYSAGGFGIGANLPYHSSGFARRGNSLAGSDEFTEGDAGVVQIEPLWQRQEVEVKKAQLLALLQVVDDRYTQCLDETHTVISAFHAATELNPQIHARFALHTISFLYKNLRERISNQILAMGASNPPKENDGSIFETSFIQKQWALQQLKRKEHQLWRPQRGLPERSVSVLRAWMFQNFLHPYPKDAEKHLLAVKSGLTRSQVSNWFINARVRLWKPMIEEMYAEMNRRKARRNDEAAENNQRAGSGRVNIDNQRFKLN